MSAPARRRRTAAAHRHGLLALLLCATPLISCGTAPSTLPPARVPPLSPSAAAAPGRLDPRPAPTWDATARAAALGAARAGLAAYARKDLSQPAWFAALAPHLSDGATAAYRRSDPQTIPISAVRGPARVAAVPSPDLALTQIRTDAGAYWVLVTRDGPTARWLIERITPPRYEGS